MFKRTTAYLSTTVLSDWDWLRALRLIAGLVLLVHLFQRPDVLTGLLGGILLVQALTNTGCGMGGSCAIPSKENPKKTGKLSE